MTDWMNDWLNDWLTDSFEFFPHSSQYCEVSKKLHTKKDAKLIVEYPTQSLISHSEVDERTGDEC
jgi:hypothetical protein